MSETRPALPPFTEDSASKKVRGLDYRLIKELWAFSGRLVTVRFACEWHDDSGHGLRS